MELKRIHILEHELYFTSTLTLHGRERSLSFLDWSRMLEKSYIGVIWEEYADDIQTYSVNHLSHIIATITSCWSSIDNIVRHFFHTWCTEDIWNKKAHSLVPRPHRQRGKGSGDFGPNAWTRWCHVEEFAHANQIQVWVIIAYLSTSETGRMRNARKVTW